MNKFMNQKSLIIIIFVFMFFNNVKAQGPPPSTKDTTMPQVVHLPYHLTAAFIIGLASVMLTLTLSVFIYAKFCHVSEFDDLPYHESADEHSLRGLNRTMSASKSRSSGIDKTVIESLPFFKFSLLKGSEEDLKCAVCLSKFEDAEILCLLPKCKHAFHPSCVDKWLESHSSCPLCRQRVDQEDFNDFTHSSSNFLLSNGQSGLTKDSNLELSVLEKQDDQGSSWFSMASSSRRFEIGDQLHVTTLNNQACENSKRLLHRNMILKQWSDVNSSDLILSMNLEMMNFQSNSKFSSSDTAGRGGMPTSFANASMSSSDQMV